MSHQNVRNSYSYHATIYYSSFYSNTIVFPFSENNHTRQCSGGSREYIAGDDQDSTPYYSYETSLTKNMPVQLHPQNPRTLARTMDPPSTNIWGNYDSDEGSTPKSPSRKSGGHTRHPSYLSAMDAKAIQTQAQNGYVHHENGHYGNHDRRDYNDEHNGYVNQYAHHKSVPDLSSTGAPSTRQPHPHSQYNDYNVSQKLYNHHQGQNQNQDYTAVHNGNINGYSNGNVNGYINGYEEHTRTIKPRPTSASHKNPAQNGERKEVEVEVQHTSNILATDLLRNGYVSHQVFNQRSSADGNQVEQTRLTLSKAQISNGRDRLNSEENYGPPIAVYNKKSYDSGRQSAQGPQTTRDVMDGDMHIIHNNEPAPPPVVQDVKITKSSAGYKLKKHSTPAFSTFKAPDEVDFDPYRELPRDKKNNRSTRRSTSSQEQPWPASVDAMSYCKENEYDDWTLSNSAHNRRSNIFPTECNAANTLGFVHNIAKNITAKVIPPTRGPSDVVRVQSDQCMDNTYGPLEPSQYKGITLPAHGGRHKQTDQSSAITSSRSQPEGLSKVCNMGNAFQSALKRVQSVDHSIDEKSHKGRPSVPAKPQIPPKPTPQTSIQIDPSVDSALDKTAEYSCTIRDVLQNRVHGVHHITRGNSVNSTSSSSSGYRSGSNGANSNISESPSIPNNSNHMFRYGEGNYGSRIIATYFLYI